MDNRCSNISGIKVLSASVKSVEDRGYILSLGVDGVTGFCKSKEATEYIKKYNNGEELSPGQIVQCVVQEAPGNKRTVNVSIDAAKIASAFVSYDCLQVSQPVH